MLKYELIDPEEMMRSEDFAIIESFLEASNQTQIGWHYVMDLVWIYSKAKSWPRNMKVLDAGGGRGPGQLLLAEMGFEVTNIDLWHVSPSPAWKDRYKIKIKTLDSYVSTTYRDHLINESSESSGGVKASLKTLMSVACPEILEKWQSLKARTYHKPLDHWRSYWHQDRYPVGRIEWITGNLCHLPEIPKGNFDAVISLSSLEHIPIETLEQGLKEICRVLKDNAHWAVTTSGTEKSETWFHEPSKGLCFSASDLNKYFNAIEMRATEPELILEKYRHSEYLEKNIAESYKKSGNNGMPWGVWNPQYFPVGICQG